MKNAVIGILLAILAGCLALGVVEYVMPASPQPVEDEAPSDRSPDGVLRLRVLRGGTWVEVE